MTKIEEKLDMTQVGLFLLKSGFTKFELNDSGHDDLTFESISDTKSVIHIRLNSDRTWEFKIIETDDKD